MEVELGGVKNVEALAFSGEGALASEAVGTPASLMKLILSSMVAAGVQYGWALQLALLTSYVQTLGLPHSLSSIMWLCGPVAGFLGPARALMADLAGPGRFTAANAIMCSWFAFGNILGYSSGANGSWHRWFPFLNTRACCEACANLKGAFLIDVVFLLFCLSISLFFAEEVPLEGKNRITATNEQRSGLFEFLKSFRHLPPGMPPVLIVTSLTWLSWFPFFLYNNDWMGREVHHGDPEGTKAQRNAYENGIRDGSLGLLLNSIVLGISSFLLEPMCRKLTTRVVWAISNFTLFFAFASISIVSIWSTNGYSYGVKEEEQVNGRVRAAALLILAALGFPLSVLFSVPAIVAAQLADIGGNGQGLSIGILNISAVIPQVIISLSAGPWDALFKKGNLPAFAMASIFAFISTVVALFLLPKLTDTGFSASH